MVLLTIRKDETYCLDPRPYKRNFVAQLPKDWTLQTFDNVALTTSEPLKSYTSDGYDKDWWNFFKLKPDPKTPETTYRIAGHSPYFFTLLNKRVDEKEYLKILEIEGNHYMLGTFSY